VVGKTASQEPSLSSYLIQFFDDEERDGSQSMDFFTVQPADVVASPRRLYWIKSLCKLQIIHSQLSMALTVGHFCFEKFVATCSCVERLFNIK
jgi:hypothetical protein